MDHRMDLHEYMRILRDEQPGPDPTSIERILAERIAICWIAAYEAELFF
jgi:hypothetical protein